MLINFLVRYLVFVATASILAGSIILVFKTPSPKIVIPIIITILLLPLPVGYIYASYFTSIPEVLVPDLTGKLLASAVDELEALKLKGKYAGSASDAKQAEGSVVSQQPEAGRIVKVGRVVNLIISCGSRKIVMPNLLGRSLSQAETVLVESGLLLGEVSRDFADDLDAGIIMAQAVLPGEEIPAGATIDITISSKEGIVDRDKERERNEGEEKNEEEREKNEDDKGGLWFW